jgi:ribosomal protein S19
MLNWKGPKINRKFLIAVKTKKLSKKIQILPYLLGASLNKKMISIKLLGFKLGEFFLTRKKVWHKK